MTQPMANDQNMRYTSCRYSYYEQYTKKKFSITDYGGDTIAKVVASKATRPDLR